MTTETVLETATFNRKVRSYWLLSGSLLCVVTIIGIPLLPLWLLFGHLITERYLQHMSCVLTDRSLKVSRGILVRQEKTVPLDKITDLGLVEGPIMRHYDLQAISVETAGTSSPGALVRLVGIDGTREFRDRVLKQREVVVAAGSGSATTQAAVAGPTEDAQVLVEIRDALLRIEQRLPEA
jgi:putative membrane protein